MKKSFRLVAGLWSCVLFASGLAPTASASDPQGEQAQTRADSPEQAASSPPDGGATDRSQEGKKSDAPEHLTALLLGSLTPEHMKQLGQMLEQDWKQRPEWGDMVLAILKGDRMRPGMGWWKSAVKRYDWSWLSGNYDANRDGAIEPQELPQQAPLGEKLFVRLDRDLDGKVTAGDLEAADGGGPMNPSAMMNTITSAVFYRLDTDSNGRVSLEELAAFFTKADSEELGFLTPEDLRFALDDPEMRRQASRGGGGEPPSSEMLRMFFTGELGWLESGPEYGDLAPDFTLSTHDGSRQVTLADSRGKKPVVLIFGSFT